MCPNTKNNKSSVNLLHRNKRNLKVVHVFGKENELKGKCENSTEKGSKSYIQAVYIRADDLTNLVPATKFAHLNVTTVLLRGLAAKRHLYSSRFFRFNANYICFQLVIVISG